MEEPVVEIETGLLRGSKTHSFEGYDFYSFKGIPYAKPPIKELRFEVSNLVL